MRPHTSYYCDMCPHTSYCRICVPSSLPAQYSLALRTLVTHMLLAAPAARPAVPAALAAIAACLAAVQGVLLKKEEPQHNLNSVLIQP